MNLSAQRGAIPITLDRPRILFYDAAATWLLVERYGVGFATELYTVDSAESGSASLRLKSSSALQYFLWAGLQADALLHDETLTLEQAGEFIRPWLLPTIFSSTMQALTGALYVPAPTGKADAAGSPATPPAKKTSPKKASTLTMRKGLRLHR